MMYLSRRQKVKRNKVNPWGAVTVVMEGGWVVGGWQGSVMSNHLIDKILYQSLMVKNIIVTKLKYLEGSVVQKLFSFYPRCTDTYKKYL